MGVTGSIQGRSGTSRVGRLRVHMHHHACCGGAPRRVCTECLPDVQPAPPAECDRACHTFCAGLQEIPAGEWFCPHCEQRRARQRQRRRQAPPQVEAGRRRRRAAAEVVELAESSQEEMDSEEERGRRPARRRRTAAAEAGGHRRRAAGAGARGAPASDLSDFVVPDDSEEDSDWLAGYAASEPARSSSGRSRGNASQRGARARRARSGAAAAGGGRARRQRRVASSGGSEDSTHDRFEDSGQWWAACGLRVGCFACVARTDPWLLVVMTCPHEQACPSVVWRPSCRARG